MIHIHNIKAFHVTSSINRLVNRLNKRLYTAEKAQQLHEVITDSTKKIRITTTSPVTEGNTFKNRMLDSFIV